MVDILESLRPRQWVKNILIWAPLFFAKRVLDPYLDSRVFLAMISFIFISSSVYLINDLLDIKKDRCHPEKKNRPIASGRVSKITALLVAGALLAASILVSMLVSRDFLLIVMGYFLMQMLYSTMLKKMVLLDVFVISFGFVLRIIAGGVAARVEISSWILLCTLLGSLFLALSKRRNELLLLEGGALSHRESLGEYSRELLQQLISVVAGATILAYALYTQDRDTIMKFGTDNLKYTIPFVVYGIFRYLYLEHRKKQGGDPSEIFIKDKPMVVNIVLFLVVVYFVLY